MMIASETESLTDSSLGKNSMSVTCRAIHLSCMILMRKLGSISGMKRLPEPVLSMTMILWSQSNCLMTLRNTTQRL
jgi:hypothetical protein